MSLRQNLAAEAEAMLVDAMRRAQYSTMQQGALQMQISGLQQQQSALMQENTQALKDVEEARAVVLSLGGNPYPVV